MKIDVVSKTHVGIVRENNEDSLLIREPYLFAVADGMGGYAAGEVASRETLKVFEVATHSLRHDDFSQAPEKILSDAFLKANEHICTMASKNSAYNGMGTTLTALYLPGNKTAYAAHIGDSRLYLYRNNCLSQVTNDHSYVAGLLAQGKITDSEAFSHPQRNMLLQAIGAENTIQTDIIQFALEAGDVLLLCTDGLSDMLRDKEIEKILQNNEIGQAADLLIEHSLANGGRDNVSVILIKLHADGEDADCE